MDTADADTTTDTDACYCYCCCWCTTQCSWQGACNFDQMQVSDAVEGCRSFINQSMEVVKL